MKNLTIIAGLKNRGFRITNVRKTLIAILSKNNKPLSASQILSELFKKDLNANKTTIYRELEFLKTLNIVREVEFGDRRKRYELQTGEHHHHILCINCGKVKDFDFDVDLKKHERQIIKRTGFMIKEHSIEFFGLCRNCQR